MYVARLRWHAALTLYSSGQTTGVVVEIHSRGVAVSAVYEGYLLPYTIQTSDIGGLLYYFKLEHSRATSSAALPGAYFEQRKGALWPGVASGALWPSSG